MKFTLEFSTDNAAFRDDDADPDSPPLAEAIAAQLRAVADRVDKGGNYAHSGPVDDSNGNTVGGYTVVDNHAHYPDVGSYFPSGITR